MGLSPFPCSPPAPGDVPSLTEGEKWKPGRSFSSKIGQDLFTRSCILSFCGGRESWMKPTAIPVTSERSINSSFKRSLELLQKMLHAPSRDASSSQNHPDLSAAPLSRRIQILSPREDKFLLLPARQSQPRGPRVTSHQPLCPQPPSGAQKLGWN